MKANVSLCGCLLDANPAEVHSYLNHPGIDILEWRLDTFIHKNGEDSLESSLPLLSSRARHKVIATNRPRREGGEFDGPEDRRIEILEKAVEAGAEWVDLEWDVPLVTLEKFKARNVRVLHSHHEFSSTPDRRTLQQTLEAMAKRGPDAVKLAAYARHPEDNLRVLELIPFGRKELGVDVIAFCMGPNGRWSRVVSLLLGSPWSYAQLSGQGPAAPGQLTVTQMRDALANFQQSD